MKQRIKIAEIVIEISSDRDFTIPYRFVNFMTKEDITYHVGLKRQEHLPECRNELDYIGDCFSLSTGSENDRFFHPDYGHANDNYAVTSLDLDNKRISIRYLDAGIPHLNSLENIFFHIGLEEILMKENRMILHSCCTKTQFGGILFSGPSGIGKSTQGDLWTVYENAEIINGDRSVLYKKDQTWHAYGSPYAGSSKYHKQESVPVRAIVMLEQGKCCDIKKLKIADAYRRLYPMLTVCDWNREFMSLLLSQLERLIADVPIYLLTCTPDRNAVEILKRELDGIKDF